ncbi:MAG: HAD family hydrolase [Oleiphilaceae bacterium]|nr:HAD family hydrolase [Oleiphilaceae bacterium]
MALAIFDLDNTLIGGDSDHAWGEFLVEQGIVDGEHYRRANDKFYEDYKQGCLDIYEYLEFALAPLAQHDPEQLIAWRKAFFSQKIKPLMLPKAEALVDTHREKGDTLLIITATNRFVTEPIAEALNIPHLIATEPEMQGQRYTGGVSGTPSFQQGKIKRLEEWLEGMNSSMDDAYFYSDSHNDLPLLERVHNPIGVDPDDQLRAICETNNWPIISLRD